jgi:hypothetical protein
MVAFILVKQELASHESFLINMLSLEKLERTEKSVLRILIMKKLQKLVISLVQIKEIPIVKHLQGLLRVLLPKRAQRLMEILSSNFQKFRVGIFKMVLGEDILSIMLMMKR